MMARDLWENWTRALPFTAGPAGFVNIGETHEVAFALAKFNGRIPHDFDAWETLAHDTEHLFIRGWAAKDATKLFLWDNFKKDVLESRSSKWEQFISATAALRKRGIVKPTTELWDNGGVRLIGRMVDIL